MNHSVKRHLNEHNLFFYFLRFSACPLMVPKWQKMAIFGILANLTLPGLSGDNFFQSNYTEKKCTGVLRILSH